MSAEIEGGMEILAISECEAFLGRGGVGILAMTAGSDAPVMRPVNFAFDQPDLLIRTGEGQILAAARAGEPASFAISTIDPFEHSGWSVIAVGKLVERARSELDTKIALRPWARVEKQHFVGLVIQEISGRRISASRSPV